MPALPCPCGLSRTSPFTWIVAALVVVGGAPERAHAQLDPAVTPHRDALVQAVRDKDYAAVSASAAALVATGLAEAIDVLAERGLLANDIEVERRVAEELFQLKKGPALTRMCELANHHAKTPVRALLCEPLAMTRDPDAFRALLQSVYDPVDGVASTALDAIALRNNLACITHLIDALDSMEKENRAEGLVAYRIRATLERLTAFDFHAAAVWRRFWDLHEKGFRRPSREQMEKIKKEILGGPTQGRTVVVEPQRGPSKQIFGVEVKSERIVFIIDVSSSMKERDPPPPEEATEENPLGTPEGANPTTKKRGKTEVEPEGESTPEGGEVRKGRAPAPKGGKEDVGYGTSRIRIRRVQDEIIRLIEMMPVDTKFSVIAYSSKVSYTSMILQPATSENKYQAIEFVRGFNPEGETWTDTALDRAFSIPDADTFVLLSDGSPVRNKKVMDARAILQNVEVANRFRRVQIHTVGFAHTAHEVGTFLSELARLNGGVYRELP